MTELETIIKRYPFIEDLVKEEYKLRMRIEAIRLVFIAYGLDDHKQPKQEPIMPRDYEAEENAMRIIQSIHNERQENCGNIGRMVNCNDPFSVGDYRNSCTFCQNYRERNEGDMSSVDFDNHKKEHNTEIEKQNNDTSQQLKDAEYQDRIEKSNCQISIRECAMQDCSSCQWKDRDPEELKKSKYSSDDIRACIDTKFYIDKGSQRDAILGKMFNNNIILKLHTGLPVRKEIKEEPLKPAEESPEEVNTVWGSFMYKALTKIGRIATVKEIYDMAKAMHCPNDDIQLLRNTLNRDFKKGLLSKKILDPKKVWYGLNSWFVDGEVKRAFDIQK